MQPYKRAPDRQKRQTRASKRTRVTDNHRCWVCDDPERAAHLPARWKMTCAYQKRLEKVGT